MRLNRRDFMRLSTAAVFLPATNVLAQDTSVSGSVTLAAYSAIFQDKYTASVVEPFMKKYPNIKVTYYPIQNSAQLLGLLRAQKERPQIDVGILDVTLAKIGTDEGIFAPLDPGKIPALGELFETATLPGVNGRVVTFDHVALLYNSDNVSSPPTSWNDLWAPQHKGKVVIEGVPDTMGVLLVLFANKLAGGDPDFEKGFEKGVQRVVELSPSVQTWEPRPNVYPHIISGAGNIGLGWNARSQFYADDSKGKLRAVLPKEGSCFQLNVINLVAKSPNAAAAEVFINYALGTEAQKAFTEGMFYAPSNRKAQIKEEALKRTAAGNMDIMMPIDWVALSKVRDRLTEQWRRRVVPAAR